MRTKNSLLNMAASFFGQIISALLSIVNRVVFLKYLNVEYMGINTLFASIISIITLVELGIGSAISVKLYKPIAQNDQKKISAYMNVYKKYYIVISFIIFVVGLFVCPIAYYLANDMIHSKDIIIIYFIYLISTSLNYLFIYNHAIISANQKQYINAAYSNIGYIIQCVIQLFVLCFYKNFVLYIFVKLFGQLFINIAISVKAEKMYSYLKIYKKEKLNDEENRKIKSDIKSIGIRKICNTVNENINTLMISYIAGVSLVGMMSNYTTIIGHVKNIISSIYSSFSASVGDLMTEDDDENKYKIFNILNFIICLIFGYFAIGILFLSNDFIKVLLDKKYIIENNLIILLTLTFYINGRMQIVSIYRNSISLFKKNRYIPFFELLIGIVISLILMNWIGVSGILIGALVGVLSTTFVFEPYNLFKYGFKYDYINRTKNYIKNFFKDMIFLFIVIIICYPLINIDVANVFIFILKGIIYTLIFSLIVFLYYRKDKNFTESYQILIYLKDKVIEKYKINKKIS